MHRAERIGTRAGEYEITGLLGRGGMGTVYAGVHPLIGTKVAIKVLDPRIDDAQVVARFIQEARVVNKIRHPNIIEIFAFGESPDLGHYFVMPWLDGMTLADRVNHVGPLAPAAAEPILRQVAEALDVAHADGVYHRDLKPENVFLTPDGRGGDAVRILDFGIAKLTDATSIAVTNEKFSMGTPLYMSPEQWAAPAQVDQRTDVYALGVMLHFMLTGRHPFEGSSPVSLMQLHTGQPPTQASTHGATAAVDPVIAKALAKDREDRYQRASELYEAFRAVALAGEPAGAAVAASGRQPGPSADRKPARAAAMATTAHAATIGRAHGFRRPPIFLVAAAVIASAAAAAALVHRLRGGDATPDRDPGTQSPPPPTAAAALPVPTAADRLAAPDAAPPAPPVAAPDDTRERPPRKRSPRKRRPPDKTRPREDVHSTWGKPDNPF